MTENDKPGGQLKVETNKEIRKTVGENIRKHRVANHLTLDTLAKFIDISPGFLGLIERGKRGLSFKNLFKLSEVLNVPVEMFFSEGPMEIDDVKLLGKARSTRVKIMKKLDTLDEKELIFVLKMLNGMGDLKGIQEE